ncbi:hypothetical protein [Actinotalea caeni]|uniref:hypothetical protein n=1 Tax=Actinotalea caeni TaxID=1348467 RepID=UPI0012E2D891|nr:hypothetical protein [Actinotalea caeni]
MNDRAAITEASELDCPSSTETVGLVSPSVYHAFVAGWHAGMIRRATQPASEEVIEEVATMLDAVNVVDALTRPE